MILTLDAATTSACNTGKSPWEQARLVLNRNRRKFERVEAGLGLADHLFPGLRRIVLRAFCSSRGLPFLSPQVEPIDSGSGATIFRLKLEGRKWILKIFRLSLGEERPRLHHLAGRYRSHYRILSSWYQCPECSLVPETQILVVNGPILNQPVVAALQQDLGPSLRDFFRELTGQELAKTLENQGEFRQQFLCFASTTCRLFREGRDFPDLIGKRNLVVAQEEEKSRLFLLDIGLVNLSDIRTHNPSRYSELERLVSRLETLLVEVLTQQHRPQRVSRKGAGLTRSSCSGS